MWRGHADVQDSGLLERHRERDAHDDSRGHAAETGVARQFALQGVAQLAQRERRARGDAHAAIGVLQVGTAQSFVTQPAVEALLEGEGACRQVVGERDACAHALQDARITAGSPPLSTEGRELHVFALPRRTEGQKHANEAVSDRDGRDAAP